MTTRLRKAHIPFESYVFYAIAVAIIAFLFCPAFVFCRYICRSHLIVNFVWSWNDMTAYCSRKSKHKMRSKRIKDRQEFKWMHTYWLFHFQNRLVIMVNQAFNEELYKRWRNTPVSGFHWNLCLFMYVRFYNMQCI